MDSNKDSKHSGAAEPSGLEGKNPSTAGKDKTEVVSPTPENRKHSIDPSSPNDAITAPSRQALERGDADNNPL